MKVSGSVLAVKSDPFAYAKLLKYAKIDCLHIDIFQDGSDLQIKDLLNFDKSYPPLDVHLIFEEITDVQIQLMNDAGVRYLDLQYETLRDKNDIFRAAKEFKGDFGLAVTAKTPLSVIDEYVNDISQVLFMCSEPGISGAEFDSANYERIRTIHDRYPSLKLFADGGINNIISKEIEKLGIEMVVSGSYLCRDITRLGTNIISLKYMDEKDIKVTRVMIKTEFLPILRRESPFIDVMVVMNHYRLGIVFVAENNKLYGIVTDGDIRRGYIEFGEAIFKKTAEELMNEQPYVADANMRIEDIYSEILVMQKGISVVPVLENDELIGAVDLRLGK